MSGIIGYVGKNDCRNFLIESVSKLKGRGKRNVGVAIKKDDMLFSIISGENDEKLSIENIINSNIGVAAVTDNKTVTPCCNDSFALALDGKVKNRDSLAAFSSPFFQITTDEELILSMLCENNENDKISVMKNVCSELNGDVTFAFISNTDNSIYVKKGSAPLVVGIGESGYYLCSELPPIIDYCKKYIDLPDDSYVKISQNKVTIYDLEIKKIKPQIKPIPKYEYVDNEFGNIDTIFTLPNKINSVCEKYILKSHLNEEKFKIPRRILEKVDRIIITACNGEYNVAKAACNNIELLSDVETLAINSNMLMGAFGYIDKYTLVLAISNSGEDMPTIKAVKRAKGYGAKIIALTSNKISYLGRISDYVLDTFFDDSFSFQINYLVLALFGVFLGDKIGYTTDLHTTLALKMSEMLQGKISSAIRNKQIVDFDFDKNIIVSGFGTDYGVAREIALGFRNLCHNNAFAVSLDELLGYKEILKNSTLMICVSSNADFDVITTIVEKVSEYTSPILYTTDNIANDFSFCENVIAVGDILPLFNPITISTAMYNTITKQIDIKNNKALAI